MKREEMLAAVRDRTAPWDLIVIGGGATGLGTAVDAASRGYDVVLFEQSDFAKGTSSRSTKLVHGGVRYLQQGNVSLVMEALTERGRLLRNAPHLVSNLAFIVPSYEWWESPFYGIGLRVYDLLAGEYGFGRSRHLTRDEVQQEIPSIQPDGLRGGTRYYDGQFDDARLAIHLAMTAVEQGATMVNYATVTGLNKAADGTIHGVTIRDEESGEQMEVAGRAIINAAGPMVDDVRRLDQASASPIVSPSQGTHLVLDRSFISRDTAIMVPHTQDGRVMFAIPWHDVAVVGTTDTPIDTIELEPRPLEEEIDFILATANRYLDRPASRADIRSAFAGIRPLVRTGQGGPTAALSREHTILIDPDSGLMSVVGGKWTTYRRMAQDVVDQAAILAGLPSRECATLALPIHGSHEKACQFGRLAYHGSDAPAVQALMNAAPQNASPVHCRLQMTQGEVIWACRHEMARTVDDLLARRSRSLLFDAEAASEAAEAVARIAAAELGRGTDWIQQQTTTFRQIASRYVAPPNARQNT
ncbi:MAG: glycerol-3-phosphate dehydrogenase/oxidase [Gemmatimonadetes bacterium]|nr:glycerol-3-phosphate dehydrogenase/oxidase [Gemmatimonadota bacterium]MBT7860887.1 glycerol-3-phosphate dehydrogenase/oxidase [Gemmatimonadota bacterium]